MSCKNTKLGNCFDLKHQQILSTSHIDQVNIFKMLVANGADVNNKGANDTTPIMIVAGQGE